MKDLLQRLVTHLAGAGVQLKLRPAVDDAALDAAEAKLGMELTPSLRALFRVADGQGGPPQYEPGAVHLFPADMRLFSLKKLLSEHASQAAQASDEGYDVLAAEDGVRCVAYHAGRIPFAGADDSAWLYVDRINGPGGTLGQVIYNTSEVDMAILGRSVEDFFERYVAALENGELVVTENDDGVHVVHAPDRDPTEDFYDVICLAE